MKPLIIIPDSNQKTITMEIEAFKKIISDVWEEGYKEGQEKGKTNSFPYITTTPYIQPFEQGPSITYDDASSICSEAKTSDNFINKRTYDKGSSNFKTNVW
jgi:hypothetical protein